MSLSESLSSFFNNRDLEVKSYDNECGYKNTSYFDFKKSLKKENKKKYSQLLLWDIENVHKIGTLSYIESLVTNKECLKVVSVKRSFKSDRNILTKHDTFMNKLRKHGWVIHFEKDSADNGIKHYFNKNKDNISQVFLVSADSDFEVIVKECLEKNVNIKILNDLNKPHWCNRYNYELISPNSEGV